MAVFVTDADDTLWSNDWQYSQAYARFFSYLYRILDGRMPNLKDFFARFFEIDGELFKIWGVRHGRVATSMLKTYGEICDWAEGRYRVKLRDEKHERKIKKIGDSPFDYTKLKWHPEAREVLRLLKEQKQRLCLLTSYDKKVWPERAKFMEVGEFFNERHVRATEFKKTAEDFIAVSGWTPEHDKELNWVAMGNAESDILPALEISKRWYGIYIPFGTTSKFCINSREVKIFTPSPIDHPRVVTINSLIDFWDGLKALAVRAKVNKML